MTNLSAQELLVKAAKFSQQKVEAFSRKEIVEKINEIKYLSAQKKIPRLSLRKEIVHLETKLNKIFELERDVAERKGEESSKVKSLKKQIGVLRRQLELSGDKELNKKVEKLSHLLGECLAKKEAKEEIQLSQMIVQQTKTASSADKNSLLKEKIETLKKQLSLKKGEADAKKISQMEEMIARLEQKLTDLSGKEAIEEPQQPIWHDVLFGQPVVLTETSAEKSLPLPPPPKRLIKP